MRLRLSIERRFKDSVRCSFWRWAEPDNGFGVSGDTAADAHATGLGATADGASDGTLYAINSTDGKELWSYPTAKEFETINRVFPAHGGAISTSGAVIVDGMVYVGSGYAVGSGASGGNVLLAFGTD